MVGLIPILNFSICWCQGNVDVSYRCSFIQNEKKTYKFTRCIIFGGCLLLSDLVALSKLVNNKSNLKMSCIHSRNISLNCITNFCGKLWKFVPVTTVSACENVMTKRRQKKTMIRI